MSRANLYVLFLDGTVRYGIYNGSSDRAWPPLFETPDEAWDAWHSREPVDPGRGQRHAWDYEADDGEPVVCATDYGSEWSWTGATATRAHVTSGHEPFGEDLDWGGTIPPLPRTKGLPLWATYPPPVPGGVSTLELSGSSTPEGTA